MREVPVHKDTQHKANPAMSFVNPETTDTFIGYSTKCQPIRLPVPCRLVTEDVIGQLYISITETSGVFVTRQLYYHQAEPRHISQAAYLCDVTCTMHCYAIRNQIGN